MLAPLLPAIKKRFENQISPSMITIYKDYCWSCWLLYDLLVHEQVAVLEAPHTQVMVLQPLVFS
jgi:hypothetical protein